MTKSFDSFENIAQTRKRINVIGLQVNVSDYESAIEDIAQMVAAKTGGYICLSNVHMVMESFDNPNFQSVVNNADMVFPDGKPLFWMQRLSGATEARQVRAPSLMPKLFEYAERNNLTIGFYGGKQSVLDAILTRLKLDFPRLNIRYAFSPPFRVLSDTEKAEIVAQINAANPDILFVGLGCPKQEFWMSEHKKSLNVVMLGVGTAFDFYAGNVAESPLWMQKIGLEWFFRLSQEPRRLWKRYLILNPRFVWLATRQLLLGVQSPKSKSPKSF
ncbi:MAG: WecB/TagA/CpsF family glycosyltransferase [Pyrinomonadaceae bacterium]|nr:WecB/TagA/CpsF family glycosyltransferase [Pyrinomonadaceae bacterium]